MSCDLDARGFMDENFQVGVRELCIYNHADDKESLAEKVLEEPRVMCREKPNHINNSLDPRFSIIP